MVDIHCHILPGVDDGASDWDMAMQMCRIAAADGITHIVATPHANDVYAYDRVQNEQALLRLRELTGNLLELSLGCDFHFSYENLQRLMADRSCYTIGGSAYLLIELSDFAIPPNFNRTIFELLSAGIRPVLTHPERHPLLQRRPEQILEWVQSGSLVQVTAGALTGSWGKLALKAARWLLDRRAVHVVASDAHDTLHRPPVLSAARDLIADAGSDELARAMVEDNPAAIIRGEALT